MASGAAAGGVTASAVASTAAATTAPAKVTTGALRIPFFDDMGVPDPDVFYGAEGLMVTNGVYDSLLQYGPDSFKVEGDVAALPKVSADGLTYTFTLHAGITFHDGTPLNSAAVAASFTRRTALKQGPSYMLAQVKSVDTPDATTLIVHMKTPVSAFLDYLASPWSPKILSPTAIKAHTVGNDYAQKWLGTHDAGSGPYQITTFDVGQKYVLTRYDKYWGAKANFPEVDISIVPSVSTQELLLEKGQVDMITHGLPTQGLADLAKKAGITVHNYPSTLLNLLFVNPNKGPFTTVAARQALEQALDKPTLTKDVFGPAATASTQLYPPNELPASSTTSVVKYDPSVLKNLVKTLPTKAVDIGYDSSDPRNQEMANFLQVTLQGLGMTATVRAIPIAQVFAISTHLSTAPDLLIQVTPPDAAHPDTFARIYEDASGGANYFLCKNPAADKELDLGLASTTQADVNKHYGAAGNLYVKNGCVIDIADVQDSMPTRSDLTGLNHIPAMPWGFTLAKISRG
ncbi:ABC transporter substrate-binding protein [Acidothermaceae bacterium B102]|nr:ABC transporter substrate-binding protein [Acidothermaceae bacterium B102]